MSGWFVVPAPIPPRRGRPRRAIDRSPNAAGPTRRRRRHGLDRRTWEAIGPDDRAIYPSVSRWCIVRNGNAMPKGRKPPGRKGTHKVRRVTGIMPSGRHIPDRRATLCGYLASSCAAMTERCPRHLPVLGSRGEISHGRNHAHAPIAIRPDNPVGQGLGQMPPSGKAVEPCGRVQEAMMMRIPVRAF